MLFPFLQSPSLSGISWYNLSSVDVGLVVSFQVICDTSSLSWSLLIIYSPAALGYVFTIWSKDKFAYKIVLNFLQTSGSLYGALFGSIVAFTIADVIG